MHITADCDEQLDDEFYKRAVTCELLPHEKLFLDLVMADNPREASGTYQIELDS